ncbi:MAG: hypothetical protein J0M35_02380 [Candidatus Obscuribacter phosphatis]|uniref:Uncharacterized protein n=1 Tax=Candidatus Obscuribacter phosphatis TaxID=1906157 RepID=A0A8J7TKQ7_9BACT|nr:hypothetical protein [Candidatus Obscuribacter phosphatis]
MEKSVDTCAKEVKDPMAPEEAKLQNEEITLEVLDAAIKEAKGDDLDINPFTLARKLSVEPHILFESRELMGRIIEARRKAQGDSATFSLDSELLLKVKELEGELNRLTEINQELYDRGLSLEDQLVAVEAKMSDLETEAETLAMQLQNSWHLGYNKGLADGKAQGGVAVAEVGEPVGHTTAEHEPVVLELTDTEEAGQTEPAKAGDKDLPEEQDIAETKSAEIEEVAAESPKEIIGSNDSTDTGEFQAKPSYNDRVYNAVSSSFVANSSKENYGSFSWREIETVYQYSTVAGRPNINLYFEPFAQPPQEEDDEQEQNQEPSKPKEAAAVKPSKIGETSALPIIEDFLTKPEEPSEQAKNQAKLQTETQPIPGAAAYFQAQAKAEEAAKQKEKEKSEESPRPRKRRTDEFHADTAAIDMGESLTLGAEFYQGLGVINADADRRPELSTFDSLTAVKTDEGGKDELDLDKLDIFEGLEDIEELSQIEVIEDVVLPDMPKNTGGESKSNNSQDSSESRFESQIDSQESQRETQDGIKQMELGPEDLRELVKNRIKQAEVEHQTEKQPQVKQDDEAAAAKLDAEAIKQGVRNKFVGGKAPSQETPAPAVVSTPRVVPPEIRKACMILGVRPEELTVKVVVDAWKREMSQPGVHPDTGGDTETAIYLNNAKVELVKWIEAQTPKLGKKFGSQQGGPKPHEPGKPFIMGQKPTDKGK